MERNEHIKQKINRLYLCVLFSDQIKEMRKKGIKIIARLQIYFWFASDKRISVPLSRDKFGRKSNVMHLIITCKLCGEVSGESTHKILFMSLLALGEVIFAYAVSPGKVYEE